MISQTTKNQSVVQRAMGPSSAGMMKPLNKITWDSFSQIAKLSGDVDHEPSTPKSGVHNKRLSSDCSGDNFDIE